jgi:hypothetical protein
LLSPPLLPGFLAFPPASPVVVERRIRLDNAQTAGPPPTPYSWTASMILAKSLDIGDSFFLKTLITYRESPGESKRRGEF